LRRQTTQVEVGIERTVREQDTVEHKHYGPCITF
jgi:hypothetical protein